MHYDELRDYYDAHRWGNHINLFSVLHFYACGEEMGGAQLRTKLFFRGSPMNNGPTPTCATQRSAAELRRRTIIYHVIKGKEFGYTQHVDGTQSTATRYILTEKGREFVDSQIQLRLDYLNQNPTHSIEQACNHCESQRLNSSRHFVKLVEERRAAAQDLSMVSTPGLELQRGWGIKHVQMPSLLTVTRHKLATPADHLAEDAELLAECV